VDEVEASLAEKAEREISTSDVGELLMRRLMSLDKIAYVRYASVYRDFQDVEAFLLELKDLMKKKRP
jgi:transcriptional repressor NrdR